MKNRWKACYKSSRSIHSLLLYWIGLIARSLCFLAQFISFYGPQFLLEISWIFKSKKLYFVFLTILLNCLQSSIYLDCLYVLKSLWQFLSHQFFECLVILTTFEYLYHILLVLLVNNWTICSKTSLLWIFSILRLLMAFISSLTKYSSFAILN